VATVSNRLKEERLLRGWSQRDLAREAGTTAETVSSIETNQHQPRPSTLRKLAKALNLEVRDLLQEPALPKVEAPETGLSLVEWLERQCGHAYLAMSKDELEGMFNALAEDNPQRRTLGLQINDEYNTFCAFPRNTTSSERILMKRTIRDSISEVAVKHGLALHESGLYPEYADELRQVFELERTLDAAAEDIA
jgi:transcriptional regulator with XRE-family HTH domain